MAETPFRPFRRAGGPAIIVAVAMTAGLLAALIRGPTGAPAAFPGKNGKIAFTRERAGNSEIYAIRADGSHQRRLTHGPADDESPDWGPRP